MSPERIRQTLAAQPFLPFTIHTGDGGTVDVLSPELTFLYPGGRTLQVLTPRKANPQTEGDFEEHRVDVFLITKLTLPPGNKSRRKTNGR